MILLNLEDMYVGELYLTEENDNMKKNKNAIHININYSNASFTDYKNDKKYSCYFVLFRKDEEGNFISMFDNTKYCIDGCDSFYRNIRPLKNYLPKQDFAITKCVTPSYAMKLFKSLFINKKHVINDFIIQNVRHNNSNILVGNLNLCIGSQTYENRGEIYNFTSLPEKLLLDKNASFQESIKLGTNVMYDYYNYLCLFSESNGKYLNYCDNQEYELGKQELGKPFITNIHSLGEEKQYGITTIKNAIIRLRKNK